MIPACHDPFRPAEHDTRTAVIDQEGNRHTYGHLAALARVLGAALPADHKTLVMIESSNTLDTVVGLLAVVGFGHVALLVDHTTPPERRDRLRETYRPDFSWASRSDTHAFVAHEHDDGPAPTLHPDLAMVLLTSGSTGSPRGVRLTHANLVSNAHAIASVLELDDTERAITSLPLSYSYGLSVLTSHLAVGAAVVLTEDSVATPRFWETFTRTEATSFAGVPLTYDLLDAAGFRHLALPSLRSFTQAGGALPRHLRQAMTEEARRRGARFFIMYGQTEATARMTVLRADIHADTCTGVGRPVPGGRVEVEVAHGEPATDPSPEGPITYHGPNVALGHADDYADLAHGDQFNGRLDTGDIGFLADDGCLTVTGRSSRFVKMSGLRIDLDAVERHLSAAGLPNACLGRGDRLVVVVDTDIAPQWLRRTLRRELGLAPTEIDLIRVAAIPRSPGGKVARGELADAVKGGAPT